MDRENDRPDVRELRIALGLALITFIVYFLSNPLSGSYYDYTYRIAGALLQGQTGLSERPPEWLNEIIPLEGRYYSAFPLGSVLTMLPLALMKRLGVIDSFPGLMIASLLAAASAFIFFLLSSRYGSSLPRRVALSLALVFGTWMWANLAFAGAWHLALGFAIVGQLGALYFTLLRPRPLLAGACFALAFGNRTEIILLAPIFIYLASRFSGSEQGPWKSIDRFIAIPLALGLATLFYNYARFSSPLDFGYARIPGVLDEPWYRNGIFSVQAIPGNAGAMLFETWNRVDRFPYLLPSGFGGSIFLSSPFLLLVFRPGSRDVILKYLSWLAIGALTLTLWLHGNPGGWQFSYRYAIELLPWVFLILLESGPARLKPLEAALLIASIVINAWGTYLFLISDYMR